MARHGVPWDEREPSAADLASIERERPLIEAELAVVEAEIVLAVTADGGSETDRRRLRRAERRVLREPAALASRPRRGRRRAVAA